MFEKEAEEWGMNLWCKGEYLNESPKSGYQKGAEFGYNKGKNEATEIIKQLLLLPYANNEEVFADVTSILDKAEQFLSEVEK